MDVLNWLTHSLDDAMIPVLAFIAVIWAYSRGRSMTRATAWADVIPLVCYAMGAAGIAAQWLKWVDVGSWPIALLLFGSVGWNGLPKVREIVLSHFNHASRPVEKAIRHIVGIRD